MSRLSRLLLSLVAVFALLHVQPVIARVAPSLPIGVVLSLSGDRAVEGELQREGYLFWSEWVNAHGGVIIAGRPYRIALAFRDDGSNPRTTASLAALLVDEEHVPFLLGPSSSATTLSEAAIAEQKGIPLIAPAATSEKIFDQGYHLTFGVTPSARHTFDATILWLRRYRPHLHRIAIVASTDSDALEAQQAAIALALAHNLRVVAADRYLAGLDTPELIAGRIAAAHAEIVLNAGSYRESVALRRALATALPHLPIFGASCGPTIPAYRRVLGSLAEGNLSAAFWAPVIRDTGFAPFPSTAKAYAAAFAHRFHHQPDQLSAAATVAGLTLQRAIERADSTDPALVAASISRLNESSFFGEVRFDAQGMTTSTRSMVDRLVRGRVLTLRLAPAPHTLHAKHAAHAVHRVSHSKKRVPIVHPTPEDTI